MSGLLAQETALQNQRLFQGAGHILLMPVDLPRRHHQEHAHRLYFHHGSSSLSPSNHPESQGSIAGVLGKIDHFHWSIHGTRKAEIR
jgi:hypothetical protein